MPLRISVRKYCWAIIICLSGTEAMRPLFLLSNASWSMINWVRRTPLISECWSWCSYSNSTATPAPLLLRPEQIQSSSKIFQLSQSSRGAKTSNRVAVCFHVYPLETTKRRTKNERRRRTNSIIAESINFALRSNYGVQAATCFSNVRERYGLKGVNYSFGGCICGPYLLNLLHRHNIQRQWLKLC